VLYEYELTNRDLLPALKPIFEHFTAAGGDRLLLEPVLGVDARYLQAAIDEMNQQFGFDRGVLHRRTTNRRRRPATPA
jgi:protein-tyrosine phosphatase